MEMSPLQNIGERPFRCGTETVFPAPGIHAPAANQYAPIARWPFTASGQGFAIGSDGEEFYRRVGGGVEDILSALQAEIKIRNCAKENRLAGRASVG